jgi:uncharacterized radical SAM superfamily Fe-S cluster-containing enzyme
MELMPLNKLTRSVCPVCLAVVEAEYIVRDDVVYLVKSCAEHGSFETPVWEGEAGFLAWNEHQNPSQKPHNPARKTLKGCPYDCGICEKHQQASCCVLLELTTRCDLTCPVCFASSGERNEEQVLPGDPPLEEIARWYDMLLERGGPFNIQLSGGEPTMRDELPEIIRMGRERGFRFFQLNTNGLRIARDRPYLHRLVEAGLNTVFLQFDSLGKESCIALRGRDITVEKKLAIENSAAEKLGVVLVPTVRFGLNDGELWEILEYAASLMPVVRGVHFQPMSFFGRYKGDPVGERLTMPALLAMIEKQSGGRIKAVDFRPGGAEHPLCSFNAQYRVRDGHWELQRSAGNSGCCGGAARTSDTAQSVVARQWSAVKKPPKQNYGKDFNLAALDEYFNLTYKKQRETLAVSGMDFQDAWNLDLERLSRCYINIVSPEGSLIPFCAYNLSSTEGRTLYRPVTK